MTEEAVIIHASTQICNICGRQAIAFWPTDLSSVCRAWCRECLDKAKNKDLEIENGNS